MGLFAQNNVSPITSSMLIFPAQDKHVHGSSLVALPNGDLLSVWFYGNGERNSDDVKLMNRYNYYQRQYNKIQLNLSL
jgi:hypothetical protein